MSIKYMGTFGELKSELITELRKGKWKKLPKKTYQFKSTDGATLMFYATTGTLLFQGKADGKEQLEYDVAMYASNDEFHNLESKWIVT